LSHAKGLRPSTTLCLKIDGEVIEEHAQGDGQFDAFMNALAKYIPQKLALPQLIDYAVRILQEATLTPCAKP
jgi:D-citramalate synthase